MALSTALPSPLARRDGAPWQCMLPLPWPTGHKDHHWFRTTRGNDASPQSQFNALIVGQSFPIFSVHLGPQQFRVVNQPLSPGEVLALCLMSSWHHPLVGQRSFWSREISITVGCTLVFWFVSPDVSTCGCVGGTRGEQWVQHVPAMHDDSHWWTELDKNGHRGLCTAFFPQQFQNNKILFLICLLSNEFSPSFRIDSRSRWDNHFGGSLLATWQNAGFWHFHIGNLEATPIFTSYYWEAVISVPTVPSLTSSSAGLLQNFTSGKCYFEGALVEL